MHAPVTRDGGADALVSPPTLDTFDNQATTPEGWGVFDCGLRDDGTPRIEIQRIDDPGDGSEPRFADDQEAWKHVMDRAWNGSALHRAALGLVDPVERMVIEGVFGWWLDTCPGRKQPGCSVAQVPELPMQAGDDGATPGLHLVPPGRAR